MRVRESHGGWAEYAEENEEQILILNKRYLYNVASSRGVQSSNPNPRLRDKHTEAPLKHHACTLFGRGLIGFVYALIYVLKIYRE